MITTTANASTTSANSDPIAHPRNTTTYTEHEKWIALRLLAECQGNLRKAARLTGIPWTTLRSWTERFPDLYQESLDITGKEQSESPADEEPDPNPLLARLREHAGIALDSVTPEKMAAATLPQVTRYLAVILPRIQALEKAAAQYNAAQTIQDFILQINYVITSLIEDQELLLSIRERLARLALVPADLTLPLPNDDDDETDADDQLVSASIDERAKEISMSERTPDTTSESERANTTEPPTPTLGAAESASTAPQPPSPPQLDSERAKTTTMSERTAPSPAPQNRLATPAELEEIIKREKARAFVPPTLEELRAIKPRVSWAGG